MLGSSGKNEKDEERETAGEEKLGNIWCVWLQVGQSRKMISVGAPGCTPPILGLGWVPRRYFFSNSVQKKIVEARLGTFLFVDAKKGP